MTEKVLMIEEEIRRTLVRMSHEVVESLGGCQDLVVVGVHTRGVPLAQRIAGFISGSRQVDVPVGALDIGLHRDDLDIAGIRPVLRPSYIPVNITGKDVVLVDDVLFTGRSIRAAMDALVDFGRPRCILLAVLIDRGHRELPIKANFVGKNIPSSKYEHIQLHLRETDGKDEVVISHSAGAVMARNRGR